MGCESKYFIFNLGDNITLTALLEVSPWQKAAIYLLSAALDRERSNFSVVLLLVRVLLWVLPQ